jgi:hypothetical protein
MRAVGQETLEPRFGFRYGIGLSDTGDSEAAPARIVDERSLDLVSAGYFAQRMILSKNRFPSPIGDRLFGIML